MPLDQVNINFFYHFRFFGSARFNLSHRPFFRHLPSSGTVSKSYKANCKNTKNISAEKKSVYMVAINFCLALPGCCLAKHTKTFLSSVQSTITYLFGWKWTPNCPICLLANIYLANLARFQTWRFCMCYGGLTDCAAKLHMDNEDTLRHLEGLRKPGMSRLFQ